MKYIILYAREPKFGLNLHPPEVIKRRDFIEVAGIEVDSLEEVFRQMNHVDGTEIVSKLGNQRGMPLRSMSSGDIALAEDGKIWFCASVGWREVTFAQEDVR